MYQYYIKRFIDICISIIGIIFMIIATMTIGPIIYFTDRGPIFYTSERIGRYGKVFKMYKFRSMYVNSPDLRLPDGSTFSSNNDLRVTKIGRFIRKTSIDELPQFINVLKGEMSIVGPRPDPPDWLVRYPDNVKIFLSVRPGITGYNQAYFRNESDGFSKMINDAYYAINCSLIFDIKIILKTIITVLRQTNVVKVEYKHPTSALLR